MCMWECNFSALNFEKVGWAYWFAFVCLSVSPFVMLFCACHILQTMHVRVLKFHIWVLHEKIADQYFFFMVDIFILSDLCPFQKKRSRSCQQDI